jgi:hypothetical protein
MIPSWAVDLEIAEQRLQAHRMAPFLVADLTAMWAVAPSFQIFRDLLVNQDFLSSQ